ncbi:MAG: nuclear transport factor 2 family protein [Phyllobacterium sp.]|uniref:nuclear transport factor 2 family protein n=1 Tax=Phyllobacterium sp. TaxID=1871046 RepID=UPI0030F1536D
MHQIYLETTILGEVEMSAECRKLVAGRAKLTASTLGLSLCLAIAATVPSRAVNCSNSPNNPWLVSTVDPPAADDHAIRKLISMYHWALDDHRIVQLQGLFTDSVTYELCNAAGEQLVSKTNRSQLELYLQDYFNTFVTNGTQARHIASNTILHAFNATTVQGKTTVVVTLQHNDIETPVLDYTASFRTEFKNDGISWKFSKMTLITDGPKLELRAR